MAPVSAGAGGWLGGRLRAGGAGRPAPPRASTSPFCPSPARSEATSASSTDAFDRRPDFDPLPLSAGACGRRRGGWARDATAAPRRPPPPPPPPCPSVSGDAEVDLTDLPDWAWAGCGEGEGTPTAPRARAASGSADDGSATATGTGFDAASPRRDGSVDAAPPNAATPLAPAVAAAAAAAGVSADAWASGRPVMVGDRAYLAIPLPVGAPRPPGAFVLHAGRPPAAHAAAAAHAALGVGPAVPDVADAWAAAALCEELAAAVAPGGPRRSLSFGDLPLAFPTAAPPTLLSLAAHHNLSDAGKRRLSLAAEQRPARVPVPAADERWLDLDPPPVLPAIKRARSAACLAGVGGLLAGFGGGSSDSLDPDGDPPLRHATHPPWASLPPLPTTHGHLAGEIVWARMLSYPWWPAQVVPPPPSAHGLRHKPGAVYVVFFGDGNCAWLSPRSLDRFGAGYAKRAAKPRRDLQAAVDAAWAAVGVPRPAPGALPPGFGAGRPVVAGLPC